MSEPADVPAVIIAWQQSSQQTARLQLSGEIGFAHAQELYDAALHDLGAACRHVELDWSGVSRLSAPAVQILLALRRSVIDAGRSFQVVAPNTSLLQWLERSGAASLFGAPQAGQGGEHPPFSQLPSFKETC
jgi:anti-anti-sigma regulatory factor